VTNAFGYSREGIGLELSLLRTVEAPAAARTALTGLCRELDVDGRVLQTLILLVSEVVSNAVLHSQGPSEAPIGLTASVSEETIRVMVTDAGCGFTPTERDPRRIEGGYGLYLLGRAASRWGVEDGSPTAVWFELDLPEQAL
jgi:anti-sigma regulatory factor (Ser/Thr protein kinase)